MRVKFSDHALQRVEESNVYIGSLKREIRTLPNIEGKLRWMTKYGVLVLEKVSETLVIVKTFIARHKYKGKKYHKGCNTF
ncbi:hypothetical protein [Paenibacillus lautus]|uniref:hypothetical protein n=1 Tax=Paenibacillus lautus TaxID=1401 RepID=UPI001C7D8793|nr:hypothetical protein [Paenibacillus lautus]